MRDFEGLSYDEIAGILTVGLSAAKMRIHRARLAFQEAFSQICNAYQDYLRSHDKARVKKA